MQLENDSSSIAASRNDAAAMDERVASSIMDAERDNDAASVISTLNDAEAGNLSFIVSERISRNASWRIMLDTEESEEAMTDLADRVAKRLDELSLRLGNDVAESRLSS